MDSITSMTHHDVPADSRVPRFATWSERNHLCVPITGNSAEDLLRRSAAWLSEFPLQELRLDYLPRPETAAALLPAHLAAHPHARFLATCRRVISGGHFAGTPEAELGILQAAAQAGCPLVDLSLESAEVLPPESVAQLRDAGAAVLISWHDFTQTGDLQAVLARMRPFAPDLYKIVPTAQQLRDNLRLFDLLRDPALQGQMVGICMGEAGVVSRVLGVRAGAAFTFAAASVEAATAPGQIDARTLRDLYRFDSIGSQTRVYGVAGDPIRSSMSPAMLNAAFAAESFDAVYLPLHTGDAADLFELARALPLDGFSVTMPLKQAVLPFLAHIDPLARQIGAVNTVRRELDGTFSGFNTDVAGIVEPLEARLNLNGARILVLGAGGAARAAAFACANRGATIFILNRTLEKARSLATEAEGFAISAEDLPELPPFDAVLNATPAGMEGNPTTLPLPLEHLRAGLVFDMVYNPQETPLLQAARSLGIATIPGVEMFVRQGARQFTLWTGSPAPVEIMREVVLRKLATAGQPAL